MEKSVSWDELLVGRGLAGLHIESYGPEEGDWHCGEISSAIISGNAAVIQGEILGVTSFADMRRVTIHLAMAARYEGGEWSDIGPSSIDFAVIGTPFPELRSDRKITFVFGAIVGSVISIIYPRGESEHRNRLLAEGNIALAGKEKLLTEAGSSHWDTNRDPQKPADLRADKEHSRKALSK